MGEQDAPPQNKDELVRRISETHHSFLALIDGLSEADLTRAGEDGWSVTVHLGHLAAWQSGIAALLRKENRYQAMGPGIEKIDPDDFDGINAALEAQARNLTADDARALLVASHRDLLDALADLDEDELTLTYRDFDPDAHASVADTPIFPRVAGNSFGHYEEHLPWIKRLLPPTDDSGLPLTVEGVQARITESYDALMAALDGANDEALLRKGKDGWSVKNLLAHIALWQNSLVAALNRQPHYTGLGISAAQARELGTDTINAFLEVRIDAMSLEEARKLFNETYAAVHEGLKAVSDDDLQRRHDFDPDEYANEPLVQWIAWETYEHYDEHLPDIKRLLNGVD